MKVIGPYRILEELGRGGMGIVYKAYQPSTGRIVALKILRPQFEDDENVIRRFRQEAKTATALTHENIVRIWDTSVDHPPYYLVMEILGGSTLTALLRQGPMPLKKALDIVYPLCTALDYAHEHGVIHRDIKPDNILFDIDGRPVLTDFGIAKAVEQTSFTITGTVFGTPDYMSPEQAEGENVDWRTDLYSLAAVLYRMLAGRAHFTSEQPVMTLRRIVNTPIPSIRLDHPHLPPEIEPIFNKALAKQPGERYQSGAEFAQALWNVLNIDSGKVSSSFSSSNTAEYKNPFVTNHNPSFSQPRKQHRILLFSQLLMAVAVIGCLGVSFWFSPSLPNNEKPALTLGQDKNILFQAQEHLLEKPKFNREATNSQYYVIPYKTIRFTGENGDWEGIPPVLTDAMNDKNPKADFKGADLQKFCLAKDDTFLYLMITLYDGNPKTDIPTQYGFQAQQFPEESSGDHLAKAWFSGNEWHAGVYVRYSEDDSADYPSEYVAARGNCLEWKVRLADMGALDNKYVKVYIHTFYNSKHPEYPVGDSSDCIIRLRDR